MTIAIIYDEELMTSRSSEEGCGFKADRYRNVLAKMAGKDRSNVGIVAAA